MSNPIVSEAQQATAPLSAPLSAPPTAQSAAALASTAQADAADWAEALLHSRRTTLPKRLRGPEPSAAQRQRLLRAAACAPDHGQLLPWRLIEITANRRADLAAAFAQALQMRDPKATEEELQQARDKAHRSPWLLLAVCRMQDDATDVPAHERLISLGAALQNMATLATAMGLGSALTSGKAMDSAPLRRLFGLTDQEMAVCFVNIGATDDTRAPRAKPAPEAFFSRLG